ncbi:MAG: DUF2892 domain-containing protein [Flavobacteriales bacterium]|nr:DUF2892 domain-containing protein [Flavobacteriales bacterium]
MKTNMSGFDRILRFAIAAIIGYLYYAHMISGTLGIVLVVLAVVFVLTSFIGFCPLYTFFGMNTCKKK